jgi:hypothetical protein
MTKRILSIGALLMVIAMLVPISIAASVSDVNCQVPFSFIANGKTLPPGLYTVSTGQGYLVLKGVHTGAYVLGMVGRERATGHARLIFLKTGERYDLSEIWSGDGSGLQIPARKHRNAGKLASTAPAERIVILADAAGESR